MKPRKYFGKRGAAASALGFPCAIMAHYSGTKPGVQSLMGTVKGREQFLRSCFKIGNLAMDFLASEYKENEALVDKLLTLTMLKESATPVVPYDEWEVVDAPSNLYQLFWFQRAWAFGRCRYSEDNILRGAYAKFSLSVSQQAKHFAECTVSAYDQVMFIKQDQLDARAQIEAVESDTLRQTLTEKYDAVMEPRVALLIKEIEVLHCYVIATPSP
jgi:hypothetical protein